MSIKAEVTSKEDKKYRLEFPCIMKSKLGTVILALGEEEKSYSLFSRTEIKTALKGTVLKAALASYTVGHYCEDWDKEDFKPLPKDEIVQLQNM